MTKETYCYVYLHLERRRTFYLPMVCDEDTTANGPAMGGLSRMS
ncbi:hypothetical protein ABEW47_26900 [Priestia megaterium]